MSDKIKKKSVISLVILVILSVLPVCIKRTIESPMKITTDPISSRGPRTGRMADTLIIMNNLLRKTNKQTNKQTTHLSRVYILMSLKYGPYIPIWSTFHVLLLTLLITVQKTSVNLFSCRRIEYQHL